MQGHCSSAPALLRACHSRTPLCRDSHQLQTPPNDEILHDRLADQVVIGSSRFAAAEACTVIGLVQRGIWSTMHARNTYQVSSVPSVYSLAVTC